MELKESKQINNSNYLSFYSSFQDLAQENTLAKTISDLISWKNKLNSLLYFIFSNLILFILRYVNCILSSSHHLKK